MSPATFSEAFAPSVNVPRLGSGAGVVFVVPGGNFWSRNGVRLCAVNDSAPPGAVTVPWMSTFAPVSVSEPRAGTFSSTSSGTVTLPSGLLIATIPNPAVVKMSGGKITRARRSALSGTAFAENSAGSGNIPAWNVMLGGVGENVAKLESVPSCFSNVSDNALSFAAAAAVRCRGPETVCPRSSPSSAMLGALMAMLPPAFPST